MKRFPKRRLELLRLLNPTPPGSPPFPSTRGDCVDGPRPCPWARCTYHLYLDVSRRTGAIKINFPDIDLESGEDLPATCALDVADAGGTTLEDVAAYLNLTRERIRQVEVAAIDKLLQHQAAAPVLEELWCALTEDV